MVFIPASASVRVLRQRLNGSEAVLDPMLEFPDKKRQSLLGRGPSRELVAAGDHRGLPAPLRPTVKSCRQITSRTSRGQQPSKQCYTSRLRRAAAAKRTSSAQ